MNELVAIGCRSAAFAAAIVVMAGATRITVVAGTGTKGFAGDGSPGTSALLATPFEAVADQRGNVYVADFDNNRIRKVDFRGIITTIAGNGQPGFSGDGGPAVKASLNGPHCVAIDSANNLYVCDYRNQRVRKIAPNGVITTVAGNGEKGFNGDARPAITASLNGPEGLAFDNAGNMLIADFDNHRIRKVTIAGPISTVAGNGIAGFTGDGGDAVQASMKFTPAVAIDQSGNIYICDRDNNRVRKVDMRGIITTFAGNGDAASSGDGAAARDASLNRPVGVATDRAGNVYIAEREGSRVRKVSAMGIITTLAASFKANTGCAEIDMPRRITINSAGDTLLLANTGNHCILKISM